MDQVTNKNLNWENNSNGKLRAPIRDHPSVTVPPTLPLHLHPPATVPAPTTTAPPSTATPSLQPPPPRDGIGPPQDGLATPPPSATALH